MDDVATLTLPEELLLLWVHHAGGKKGHGAPAGLEYGLAGGELQELIGAARVTIEAKNVVVVDVTPVGDVDLDAALRRVAAETRARSARWWVVTLHNTTKHRYAERLAADGIIDVEKHKLLGLIPLTTYPERVPDAVAEILNRLRGVLLDGAEADRRTTALIGLVAASRFAAYVLPDRTERTHARARLREAARGDAVTRAVDALVRAANAPAIV